MPTITASQGFPPEREESPDADVFRLTLDPGATVTFVAELASSKLPQLHLWEPDAYTNSVNGLTLYKGIVLGIAGLLALILTMIAGIVLGMGMPTTPAYIVQVALLVPALVRLGVQVEAAHLFVFYFAILSAITPPVAIAVFAACGIARSPIWETSMISVRLALTGYIIPFMFVFGPSLLMIGHWTTVLTSAITAFIGVSFLAIGLQGYLFAPLRWLPRLLFIAAAFTLIKPGIVTDAIGVGLAAMAFVIDFLHRRSAAPLLEPEAAERTAASRAPVSSGGE